MMSEESCHSPPLGFDVGYQRRLWQLRAHTTQQRPAVMESNVIDPVST
jgi:hypothetical protein